MSADWRRWGPYLTERQWGTVREDYSADGDAWDYFPHDHARQPRLSLGRRRHRRLRDDQQRLCLSLAFWNGRDPILKERLFGLTNREGNHGEDVKELYYYLDATPTHSYLKMLYKYPQRAFPYARLVEENRRRGRDQPEFELLDTGIFDDDRYFDVFVEYAKAAPDDILMQVTVHNRGPEQARFICCRNLVSQYLVLERSAPPRPRDRRPRGEYAARAASRRWAITSCTPRANGELLFCENETNRHRLFGTEPVERIFQGRVS